MSIEKRQFSRIQYQVPLIYEDKDEVYLGKINNISLHGIELREFPHFPQSKIFRISFPLAHMQKLDGLKDSELSVLTKNPENGPKTLSVHLELMRKQWDPDQVKSKGSVIGGRFSNETANFSNKINAFFDNYIENINFIKNRLNVDPYVVKTEWFQTLTMWLGIPEYSASDEGALNLKRYLDQSY